MLVRWRRYRNGISVIDVVDMLAEDCVFSNSLPNGTGRVSPMAGVTWTTFQQDGPSHLGLW